MKEAIYTLTSSCLDTGVLRLTYSLRRVLEGLEAPAAVTPTGERLVLEVDWEAGEVRGLGGWLAAEGFAPNDQLRFVREGETLSLAPLTRRVRATKGPLPREESAPQKAKPAPARRTFTPPKETPEFVQQLAQLGFEPAYLGGPWLFTARLGRKAFSLVAGDGKVGPEALAEARAAQGADAALLLAPEGTAAPAGVAVMAPESLSALLSLHRVFPLGPLELRRLLAKGRVTRADIDALGREVEGLLGERAAFSAVLSTLARFRPQQVFLLEDLLLELGEAIPGDVTARVLEVLAGPPFFALARLGRGEYQLRQPVTEVLDQLAAYAERLKARLPVGG